MMYDYYTATNDFDFIKQNLDILEKEYEFWQTKRNVSVVKDGKEYLLNQYLSEVDKPRQVTMTNVLFIRLNLTVVVIRRLAKDMT